MPFEKAQDVFPIEVTPTWGKGALGTWRFKVGQLGNRDEPPQGPVCKVNQRRWGACVPALKLRGGWKGLQRKCQGENRVGEIPMLGIAGGLAET